MKKLLQDTSTFLSATHAKAQTLTKRFGELEKEIPAYDLDYENFVAEILSVCKSYGHLD